MKAANMPAASLPSNLALKNANTDLSDRVFDDFESAIDAANSKYAIDGIDRALLRLLRQQPQSSAGQSHDPQEFAAIDWSELGTRAREMGIATLVLDSLQRYPAEVRDGIPAEAMQILKAQSNASTLFNLLLYRQLHTLLQVFHDHNIDVLLLKGAYFAKVVYRKIGLRTMSDLDLMVRKDDLGVVYRLLDDLGFEPGTETLHDNDVFNPRETAYHHWFSHKTNNLKVEIHWMLEEPNSHLNIDVDEIWASASTSELFNLPVYLLSPEATLLHQCIHISSHHVFQYYSLRGICDIKHLVEFYGPELDWERVCKLATAWHAKRSTYLSLLLAHRLLQADVPPFVFSALSEQPVDARIYTWALQRLLGKVDQNERPWASSVARWQLANSWTGKLQSAARLVFPPRRQIAAQYQISPNSPRLWLAYCARLGKVAKLMWVSATTTERQTHPDAPDLDMTDVDFGRTALILWLRDSI